VNRVHILEPSNVLNPVESSGNEKQIEIDEDTDIGSGNDNSNVD
jgi:hypothetical protein